MTENLTKAMGKDRDMTFSLETLMEAAIQKTGLMDWGKEDFKYPLDRLVNFFMEQYGGGDNKLVSFAYTVIEHLSKRLYIQDNFNSHPGIADIPVDRPMFITGLPRTGTTLMHNLMSCDPGWRILPYWELQFPYQRRDIPNFEKYAIHLARQGLKALYSQRPEFLRRHETTATGPEECFNLIRLTFYSIAWANEWYLTGYLKWLLQQEMTVSYRYYRSLLQLLLHRKAAKHLLLKCPAHLFTMDALFNVFPDANVVWMHRNPCSSIASGLSLLAVFHERGSEPDEFIELYMSYFKKSLEKAGNFEKTHKKQVKSISYDALLQNPLEVIRDIYHHFNYPWDNQKESQILAWLAEHPQHKHGVHRYSLEKFGLSRREIETRFSHYFDLYGHLI
jgi:hypothetical protein